MLLTGRAVSRLMLAAALVWLSGIPMVEAQDAGGSPPTARALAPIDLTGYWTAVITEDWHVRMLTAPKGDFGIGPPGAIELPGVGLLGVGPNPAARSNIPYRPAGAQAAMTWDSAKDEADGNACKAYGAAGIMRSPTRLHVTWQDDNTLKMEADYGTQTRLFVFGLPPEAGALNFVNATYFPPEPANVEPPAGLEPSWQGYSIASWTIMDGGGTFERGGSLKVVTTHLRPGYYWKNGMPYTGDVVLTEHFRTMELPDGSRWIRLTQIVDDPDYLVQPWVVNYQFKKLPDGSQWNPTPCSVE